MNSPLLHVRMSALAYLYDNIHDLPTWFRHLTPTQLEEIAGVMIQWQLPSESHCIVPMEEVERREMLRAFALCGGDAIKAAESLKIGKTTMYRKLRAWGYAVRNRSLLAQASALANVRIATTVRPRVVKRADAGRTHPPKAKDVEEG